MEPARHLRAVEGGAASRRRLRRVAIPTPAARRVNRSEGAFDDALGWLLSAARLVAPRQIGALEDEIEAKLARLPTPLNEFGYDPWGFSPHAFRRPLLMLALLYRYYFRVEMRGTEHFPEGRFLLIANHAGQLPLDGAMLITGCVLEPDPPRLLRGMAEYWMPTLPFVGTTGVRIGSVVGTPKNCEDLLRRDEAVIAFPEGVRGLNKTFAKRYQLQRFGLGFLRLALATDTPILPTVIIGSEEQAPAFTSIGPLARLIGAPAFPVTPTFPLLGPLGLLPLPVKYHVEIGPPMHFTGNPNDEDAVIEGMVQQVKREMTSMIDRGLRSRSGVFTS
ncbi:MAG: acyltransferase family protein [Deltaproteobacteria bacterium]|nr:acyltransferase family protein [Deltaproteobacteria bacterium]